MLVKVRASTDSSVKTEYPNNLHFEYILEQITKNTVIYLLNVHLKRTYKVDRCFKWTGINYRIRWIMLD